MANKCAICGAEVNVFQAQKLMDGNYICRKNCRAKGMKVFDYVHGSLPQVVAHNTQVEQGTKLWNLYFVPRMKEKDKEKKLKRFGANVYVAADIGLMAYIQNDYKFIMFGKTTRACVYRIADLCSYEYEVQEKKTDKGNEKESFVRMSFGNTEGMYEFAERISSYRSYEDLVKYFDKLFGIQKTLGNIKNTWKNQTNAVKNVTSGFKEVLSNSENAEEKAAAAAAAVDKAQYGDRTELIRKADEALSALNK